jgi:retron-type reverse transcriptase
MELRGGWVIDVDVASLFDPLDHRCLGKFLEQGVGDGLVRGAIDDWLVAGVMSDRHASRSTTGTPQGG